MPIDPFFEFVPDTSWNALIGRQGEEYYYIDGYIQAASDLAESIISKKLWSQRDTLILPILYNARHSVELLLKSTHRRTVAMGFPSPELSATHDIQQYFGALSRLSVGDLEFRHLLNTLSPFVESLSRIDSDGQSLRYFELRDGPRTLQSQSVVNIKLVAHSLHELKKLVSGLQHCVRRLELERRYGFHTSRCSRSDLLNIAEALPPRDQWNTVSFDEAKQKILEKYELSNRAFSDALNVIQSHRLMKVKIGILSDLFCIADEKLVSFVQIWRTLHGESESKISAFGSDEVQDEKLFQEMIDYQNAEIEAARKIEANFPPRRFGISARSFKSVAMTNLWSFMITRLKKSDGS